MSELSKRIISDLSAALAYGKRVSFVVPGGTTPAPIFDQLCSANIDWHKVDVMLSDERWVPINNPRSNTYLLNNRLFVDCAAQAGKIPLYLPRETPEIAIAEIQDKCSSIFPISVLLLGMGLDMHTASLFPGADKIDLALSNDAPVLLAMRSEKVPEARITITAPYLNQSRKKYLVILGKKKREALERAITLPYRDAPINAVLDNCSVLWAD